MPSYTWDLKLRDTVYSWKVFEVGYRFEHAFMHCVCSFVQLNVYIHLFFHSYLIIVALDKGTIEYKKF